MRISNYQNIGKYIYYLLYKEGFFINCTHLESHLLFIFLTLIEYRLLSTWYAIRPAY